MPLRWVHEREKSPENPGIQPTFDAVDFSAAGILANRIGNFSAACNCIKEPRPGNLVIALINGQAVVKKFLRQKGRIILRSTNPRYEDIEIKETDQFVIDGVVLRIVEGAV